MAMYDQFVLQKAIYTCLSEDSTLTEQVSGIFDHVPQGAKLPYLVIGEMAASDWSSATTQGAEYQMTLHAYSRQGGQKEASAILSRVHQLLHDADLAVEGNTLVMLRFISGQVQLDRDGETFHGTIRFKALLQND